MLNDLTLLARGVEEVFGEQSLLPQHKNIAEPGKLNLLRVTLGENSNIRDISLLNSDQAKQCWTLGDGNKNQFPAIKLPFPLRLDGVEKFRAWKKENKNPTALQLSEIIERLRAETVCDLNKQDQWPGYYNKIKEKAKTLAELEQRSGEIVYSLYQRFLNIPDKGLALLTELDERLWDACCQKTDKNTLKIAALIYFGDGQKLDQKGCLPDGRRATLLIDTQNNSSPYASNRKWIPAISEVLFAHEKPGAEGICALSGDHAELTGDTFPKEKLNIIGHTTVYSKYTAGGNRSVKRYGRGDASGYQVSTDLVGKCASALRFINSKKKGTTWDSVPSTQNTPDLLIAYCQAKSDVQAANFVTCTAYDGLEADDYEIECQQICESFKGAKVELLDQVNFLLLHKVNDGNQKIIYLSTSSLGQLVEAGHAWSLACKNIPEVYLPVYTKEGGGKTYRAKPKPISPKHLAMLMRKHFARNGGLNVQIVHGSTFTDCFRLFIGTSQTQYTTAMLMLPKALRQFSNLLKLAANRSIRLKLSQNQDALNATTVIGLLLAKINLPKEEYMESLAYKLGQICAALDEVHIGYCHDQRNGQIPPSLIGDQTFSSAAKNPATAFTNLPKRWIPYSNWARNYSTDKFYETSRRYEALKNKDRSAGDDDTLFQRDRNIVNAIFAWRWLKQSWEAVLPELQGKPVKNTPQFSAALLLGYFAGRHGEAKHTNNDN